MIDISIEERHIYIDKQSGKDFNIIADLERAVEELSWV